MSNSTEELGDRLVDLLPIARIPSGMESAERNIPLPSSHRVNLFSIPEDPLGLILRFLHIHEAVVLTLVSKKVIDLVSSTQNNIWFELYNSYFPLRMDDYSLWLRQQNEANGIPILFSKTSGGKVYGGTISTAQFVFKFIQSKRIDMKGWVGF